MTMKDTGPGAETLSLVEFRARLKRLLNTRVAGLSKEDVLEHGRKYAQELSQRDDAAAGSMELRPFVNFVPTQAGRRPLDEAISPGHGSSEAVAFVSSVPDGPYAHDDLWLLYRVRNLYVLIAPFNKPFTLRLSASFVPTVEGDAEPCPVPGLQDLELAPQVVSPTAYPELCAENSTWEDFHKTVYAASLHTTKALLPGKDSSFAWESMPEGFRARSPDGSDPFTFANQFFQDVRFDVEVRAQGFPTERDSHTVRVFDVGRFGSLYQRLLEKLVRRDTAAQAARAGREGLHEGYHPWYPVLTIGTDKAWLYLRAIHQDLAQNRKNLPDPGWLLRVGLYLELLTCLGIFEAVRAEHPDLLSPEERYAFEHSPRYAEVRKRIDVEAWRKVWGLREIALRGATDLLSAGPVSLLNLLRKQKATLAFLHAHHEDLKHAIALAGPNHHNAQETWHRVFRDAERAVLRNTMVAFPELGALPPWQRDFALWHQSGKLEVFGKVALPSALTGLFGDQDGVYPSACRQYRASMNDVAAFARTQGLMDFTGSECVPRGASLFEAYLVGNNSLLGALQHRDGYGPTLDLTDALPGAAVLSAAEVTELFRRVPLFHLLTDRELARLAAAAGRRVFGLYDRVVVQGQEGSSLFVVAAGELEVLLRQADGEDQPVATLEEGSVFGEYALLAGESRRATVRALRNEVVLYEVNRDALRPILEARPQLVAELGALMARRAAAGTSEEPKGQPLAARIRRFVFG